MDLLDIFRVSTVFRVS